MPIPIEAFREPKFIKHQTTYPLSYNKRDRFYKFETNPRSYRGADDTVNFKQGGYNPNHQSTRVERVNLYVDEYTLKSR